jgi:anti-sigma regulatory factor (Ser/Thr protein kinase)
MSRRARILVPGEPYAVAFARDRVMTQVRAWGVPLDEEMRAAVKLVASELITNAVVHAGGLVTIGLYLDEDRLLLTVHDRSSEQPRHQHAAEEDEDGRGLVLVDSFATRHGWQPTPNGKRVWAEFAVYVPSTPRRAEGLCEGMWAARDCAPLCVMPERLAVEGVR